VYRVSFSRQARKSFLALPARQARRVREAILRLQENPRRPGVLKLEHAPVAQYRYRVGDWRILYDIDDRDQVLAILDVRKRDEHTYR
jgi:mRNA interferase RelE/StbE